MACKQRAVGSGLVFCPLSQIGQGFLLQQATRPWAVTGQRGPSPIRGGAATPLDAHPRPTSWIRQWTDAPPLVGLSVPFRLQDERY